MAIGDAQIGNYAQETTEIIGVGAYNLDGIPDATFQSFISAQAEISGDPVGPWTDVAYHITDGTDHEIGIGTLTDGSPDTLTRGTILESTNAGAAVSWSEGVKTIVHAAPGQLFEYYRSKIAIAILSTLIDAKGDILGGTADDIIAKLTLGTNDFVLTADSGQAIGFKWAAVSSLPVVDSTALVKGSGDDTKKARIEVDTHVAAGQTRAIIMPNKDVDLTEGSGDFNKYSHPNHSGDVTSSGDGSQTIASNAVGSTKIASGAVRQGKLSTALDVQSASSGAAALLTFTSSGQYGFLPQWKNSSFSPFVPYGGDATGTNNGYLTKIGVLAGVTGTTSGRVRYVTASPPYDLGDGEVAGFLFLKIDSLGNIVRSSLAPDPPWGNSGPTIIRPDFVENGVPFRMVKPSLPAQADARAKELFNDTPRLAVKTEITFAYKNSDMSIIPHSFVDEDNDGMTIVIIDPMDPLVKRLIDAAEEGDSPMDLIHDGDLRVDNIPLTRGTPPGIPAHKLVLR